VDRAFLKVDRVPEGRKAERGLAPVITNQGERDDATRWMSVCLRGTRQFEYMRENFYGNSVDGGLSVLPAGEDDLHAREERSQFSDFGVDRLGTLICGDDVIQGEATVEFCYERLQ